MSQDSTPKSQPGVRRLRDLPELPRWAPRYAADIWDLARRGIEVDREDETRVLAMLDHPALYLIFDHEDDLPDEFLIGEANPRLHVLMHQAVENQLIEGEPQEAAQALQHLLELGVSRHRAVHLILEGFLDETYRALRTKEAFRNEVYRRHLRRLATAHDRPVWTTGPRPGRNDPCPCGSGKKYKHCCLPYEGQESVALPRGRMVLDSMFIATPDGLDTLPDDHPYLALEDLAAVARAIELTGNLALAAEAYRRLQAAAETAASEAVVREDPLDLLVSGLQELLEFAERHPQERAADGIPAALRLAELVGEPGQAAAYRLDAADLYEMAGDDGEAERIYRQVIAATPPDGWCYVRWARRLEKRGERLEAEAQYRRVLGDETLAADDAGDEARLELADLLEEQGRGEEAEALRREQRRREQPRH